jgi:hypothetical protein
MWVQEIVRKRKVRDGMTNKLREALDDIYQLTTGEDAFSVFDGYSLMPEKSAKCYRTSRIMCGHTNENL